MAREPVSYQETTAWPAWVSLLTVVSLGAAGVGIWLDPEVSRSTAALVTALLLSLIHI